MFFYPPPLNLNHLFAGKTFIFRLCLHCNFFSRRIHLNNSYSFSPSCLLLCQPNHPRQCCFLCWQLVFFWQHFPSPVESLPCFGSPRGCTNTCAGRAEAEMSDQDRTGCRASLGCSATTDVNLSVVFFCSPHKISQGNI